MFSDQAGCDSKSGVAALAIGISKQHPPTTRSVLAKDSVTAVYEVSQTAHRTKENSTKVACARELYRVEGLKAFVRGWCQVFAGRTAATSLSPSLSLSIYLSIYIYISLSLSRSRAMHASRCGYKALRILVGFFRRCVQTAWSWCDTQPDPPRTVRILCRSHAGRSCECRSFAA